MSAANFGISLHSSIVSNLTRSETFSSITLCISHPLRKFPPAPRAAQGSCSIPCISEIQPQCQQTRATHYANRRFHETEVLCHSLAHLCSHLLTMGSSSPVHLWKPTQKHEDALKQPSSSSTVFFFYCCYLLLLTAEIKTCGLLHLHYIKDFNMSAKLWRIQLKVIRNKLDKRFLGLVSLLCAPTIQC